MSKNDWRNISNVLRININVSNDDDSFFNSYDEKYIHTWPTHPYDAMVELIKERTEIVKKVLELKKFKYEIVDIKRIKIILKRIKKRSKIMKIDPKITERIWINMIRSYIDFERRNFKKK